MPASKKTVARRAGRKTFRRRRGSTNRGCFAADGTEVDIKFRISQGHVCLVELDGTEIPLFRIQDMGVMPGKVFDPEATLISTIATVMDNMDAKPEDNGVC